MKTLFWTPKRIQIISVAVIAAILLGIAWVCIFSPQENVLMTQGDFPSFYAAAKIMQGGMAGRLYSGTLQRSIQHAFWPYITTFYIYFPYPPYFATLLSPLAALPPAPAKALWDILMTLCGILSLIIGSKIAPVLGRNKLATTAWMLSCTPILMAVLGSQNITLGMLLYACLLWSFSSKKIWSEYLCGIFLGLWLFKPHYPLILACLFLAAGYYRVVLGFFMVAALYYFISVLSLGWRWPEYWFMAIRWFSQENARMAAHKMVSLLGFCRTSASLFQIPDSWGEISGKLLAASCFAWILKQSWEVRHFPETSKKLRALDLLAAAGPALILISPHTLFYDIGICVFSCARFMNLKTDRGITLLILLQIFLILSVALRMTVAFQPIFFAVIGAFFFVQQKLKGK